jgi:hypothetical protein
VSPRHCPPPYFFRRSRLDNADNRPERAVEEERVLTAEAVAKQPRKGVEGHGILRDGERDRASLASAHAVANLLRGAIRANLRMHLAVDNQHRPGLRRVSRRRRAQARGAHPLVAASGFKVSAN